MSQGYAQILATLILYVLSRLNQAVGGPVPLALLYAVLYELDRLLRLRRLRGLGVSWEYTVYGITSPDVRHLLEVLASDGYVKFEKKSSATRTLPDQLNLGLDVVQVANTGGDMKRLQETVKRALGELVLELIETCISRVLRLGTDVYVTCVHDYTEVRTARRDKYAHGYAVIDFETYYFYLVQERLESIYDKLRDLKLRLQEEIREEEKLLTKLRELQ